MNDRNPVEGSQGRRAGKSARELAGLAEGGFDFEVVPSRRRQQTGKHDRARRGASDEADRRRAGWDVTGL